GIEKRRRLGPHRENGRRLHDSSLGFFLRGTLVSFQYSLKASSEESWPTSVGGVTGVNRWHLRSKRMIISIGSEYRDLRCRRTTWRDSVAERAKINASSAPNSSSEDSRNEARF